MVDRDNHGFLYRHPLNLFAGGHGLISPAAGDAGPVCPSEGRIAC